jgi:hypothetical protein
LASADFPGWWSEHYVAALEARKGVIAFFGVTLKITLGRNAIEATRRNIRSD